MPLPDGFDWVAARRKVNDFAIAVRDKKKDVKTRRQLLRESEFQLRELQEKYVRRLSVPLPQMRINLPCLSHRSSSRVDRLRGTSRCRYGLGCILRHRLRRTGP